MTLDELIKQCSYDTDETQITSPYTGDDLTIVTKYVAGINYAYQKICRERFRLYTSDTVTLDANQSFDISMLMNPCIEIVAVETAPNYEIPWKRRFGNSVYVPGMSENDSVIVSYAYVPPRLTLDSLDDSPLLPEHKVDHRILCYYADFEYLKIEVDAVSRNRADTWLALFNDGFDRIVSNFGEVRQIQAYYDPGW